MAPVLIWNSVWLSTPSPTQPYCACEKPPADNKKISIFIIKKFNTKKYPVEFFTLLKFFSSSPLHKLLLNNWDLESYEEYSSRIFN